MSKTAISALLTKLLFVEIYKNQRTDSCCSIRFVTANHFAASCFLVFIASILIWLDENQSTAEKENRIKSKQQSS